MNKSIVAIAVAGLVGGVGVSSVASAMEFSVYGSLRAGINQVDADDVDLGTNNDGPGNNAGNNLEPIPVKTVTTKGADDEGRDAWDFGTGNAGSRIGIRGSEDLGNGASAGFHIEYGTDSGTTERRHENVWLQGGWGKLTLGEQGNPYRAAANWDQATWLGGNNRFDDGGTRSNGIRYDSNISGPFSFSVMATADSEDSGIDADPEFYRVNAVQGNTTNTIFVGTPEIKDEDGIDAFIAAAHFAVGDVATVNVGFITNNVESNSPGNSYDNAVISAEGSAGPLDWYIAYEENDDNVKSPTIDYDGDGNGTDVGANDAGRSYVSRITEAQDAETVGVFLGWNASERDLLYLEYEDSSVDGADVNLRDLDQDALLFGYSHSFGPATTFIVEYVTVDRPDSAVDSDGNRLGDSNRLLAFLKVDF